jgi:hypothetical protein
MGILKDAVGLIKTDKSKDVTKELGAGFAQKLAKYRAGQPDNYDTQFFQKLAYYESLYGKVDSPFKESQAATGQAGVGASYRGTTVAKTGSPGLDKLLALPWYALLGIVVGVGFLVWKFLFKRKRRR